MAHQTLQHLDRPDPRSELVYERDRRDLGARKPGQDAMRLGRIDDGEGKTRLAAHRLDKTVLGVFGQALADKDADSGGGEVCDALAAPDKIAGDIEALAELLHQVEGKDRRAGPARPMRHDKHIGPPRLARCLTRQSVSAALPHGGRGPRLVVPGRQRPPRISLEGTACKAHGGPARQGWRQPRQRLQHPEDRIILQSLDRPRAGLGKGYFQGLCMVGKGIALDQGRLQGLCQAFFATDRKVRGWGLATHNASFLRQVCSVTVGQSNL